MAQQNNDTKAALAARIVKEDLKGWTVEAAPAGARDMMVDGTERAQADDVVPSLDELKRHFLGDAAYRAQADAVPNEPGAEVVTVRSGEQRKIVGVNTNTGKVEWRQG